MYEGQLSPNRGESQAAKMQQTGKPTAGLQLSIGSIGRCFQGQADRHNACRCSAATRAAYVQGSARLKHDPAAHLHLHDLCIDGLGLQALLHIIKHLTCEYILRLQVFYQSYRARGGFTVWTTCLLQAQTGQRACPHGALRHRSAAHHSASKYFLGLWCESSAMHSAPDKWGM